MKSLRRSAVALTAVAAVLLPGCAASTAPDTVATAAGRATLPVADLPLLGEDETVATTTWRDRPTVINFWATWCAFCVEEMPDFQAVSSDAGEAVRFVGVDREDRVAEALELARRTGVTYMLVEDPDGSFFRAVGARGMPTTLFVDADGVVLYAHAGPLTQRRLRELVGEHFGLDV